MRSVLQNYLLNILAFQSYDIAAALIPPAAKTLCLLIYRSIHVMQPFLESEGTLILAYWLFEVICSFAHGRQCTHNVA